MGQFSLRDAIQQHVAEQSEGTPSQLLAGSINQPEPVSPRHPSWALERHVLCRLLKWLGGPAISIELWDQQQISGSAGASSGRVLIRDRTTLWKLFLRPLLEFGEAYAEGRLEVDGDLAAAAHRNPPSTEAALPLTCQDSPLVTLVAVGAAQHCLAVP